MSISPGFQKRFFAFALLLGLLPLKPGDAQENRPAQSEWLQSQKAVYGTLLRAAQYDVLVAPFQIRGNAVDRPARSLMMRCLDDQLRRTTTLRLPSPTLVSRALGEEARSLDEREVYDLADALKVKYLVRGYVSHDLDERLDVEIQFQERQADGTLSPQGVMKKASWTGILFSDERPPEEAFCGIVESVAASLPFVPSKKIKVALIDDQGPIAVPPSMLSLVSERSPNPLENAWRLQFLGLLVPQRIEAGERFFERSLVALAQLSPRSPGYALLRSRALFYLHRRPAAVAALGNPSTSQEKAFAAFLDADLPEMTKQSEDIRSPLPRLFAQIELNDLRWAFDHHLPRQDAYAKLAGAMPDWNTLLMIRLQDRNYWEVSSNFPVKERLDKEFPLPGYTAESLATSRLMLVESPEEAEEIALSVQRHVRKVVDARGKEMTDADDSMPVPRDALDLYAAGGEANLVKKAYLRAQIQQLPEEALRVLDLYDGVYRGHPALTYLRALALSKLARERQEDSRASLLRTSRERAADAFFWSGGQTATARDCVNLLSSDSEDRTRFSTYDRDYPHRWDWSYSGSEDRRTVRKEALSTKNRSALAAGTFLSLRNAELALLYTHFGFSYLSFYYNQLVSKGNAAAAEAFLATNERRFSGYPQSVSFLAGIRRKKGDDGGAARIYEEAIREVPEVWKPYEEYGDILLERGEIDNAFQLFRKYPPFVQPKNENWDHVAISNSALFAGGRFWSLGETDKALPFFRISADSRTGAGSEMRSSARIAIIEQDFPTAALRYLEEVKRYNQAGALFGYLSMLHLMGLGKQAWSVFDSFIGKVSDSPIWSAALVGFRVDGQTDEEILQWLARDDIRKAAGMAAGERLLPIFLIDRAPDLSLAEKIRKAETAGDLGPKKETASGRGAMPGRPSDMYEFFVRVREAKWDEALFLFRDRAEFFRNRPALLGSTMHYFAWASARSGTGLGTLSQFLDLWAEREPFGYRLAQALLHGAQGQHQEAIRFLHEAHWRIPKAEVQRDHPIDPWYQLVEACEWLYASSKQPEYRELAIAWARKHERIRPMDAWAYAVEAKYAESATVRLRALALALYLDRRSERIADVPQEEKEKAQVWLEKNNPFKGRKPAPAAVSQWPPVPLTPWASGKPVLVESIQG